MAMMATISLIQQDLGGTLDWIDPMHYRCGSGQTPKARKMSLRQKTKNCIGHISEEGQM